MAPAKPRAGARTGTRAAIAAAVVAFALAAAACEALVGDSLSGTIDCTGDLPGICPAGQACISGKCAPAPPPSGCEAGGCFVLPDARRDTFVSHVDAHVGRDVQPPPPDTGRRDGGHPPDARHDTTAPLGALGAPCDITKNNCANGFCIDTQDLAGLGLSGDVCSSTCCADGDCEGGVCYPTTGGNFCVTQQAARNCPATLCGSACCSDKQCTGGKFCAIGPGSVPSCQALDENADGGCGDFGCTGEAGTECFQSNDCENGVCIPIMQGGSCDDIYGCVCFPQTGCCQPSDCQSGKDHRASCQWLETATQVFRGCQDSPGDGGLGAACTSNATCQSGTCGSFPGGDVCTQPCCQTSDCQVAGWVCAPQAVMLMTAGSTPLLVCQPPPPPP
jgi:hypothetical protein